MKFQAKRFKINGFLFAVGKKVVTKEKYYWIQHFTDTKRIFMVEHFHSFNRGLNKLLLLWRHTRKQKH